MRKKVSILSLVLVFAMVLLPLTVAASTPAEPEVRFVNGTMYVPLRTVTYGFGASVDWNRTYRAAVITGVDGETHKIVIEGVGGFIENGVSWVPLTFVEETLVVLLTPTMQTNDRIQRLDLTLWDEENFQDIREATFSTDLPYGVIAVNYIEYMSNNLCGRSAFTYRELEAAVWIVEELLAMGHDWDTIYVQEFTYWDINNGVMTVSPLSWATVTSSYVLGVGREHLLRPDRVSQNIILTLPGQSQRKIIVGAHYDSPPYPSASDNASGTALLLESAQRMMDLGHYYTIVYVFFGAEEVGLAGAFYYYDSLTQAQRDNIVMMVNADVLIEGPYTIYSAGAAPSVDDIDMDALIDAIVAYFIENLIEHLTEEFDDLFEDLELTDNAYSIETAENDYQDFYLPIILLDGSLEAYLEFLTANMTGLIESLPPHIILMEAAIMGLIEPLADPVSQQVSAIAAELSEQYNFQLLSIPGYIAIPSDHLVFLLAGHTVINLMGLERYGVLDQDIVAQLTRYGEYGSEFTGTILHSPLDEFHFIEYHWPGMMNANMEAFVRFLKGILMGRYS